MGNRRGKRAGRKAPLAIVRRDDGQALRSYFAEHDQVLLPWLELIEDAQSSVDELIAEAARSFVERLLTLSAQEVAGAKHPGQATGEVRWHGQQRGRIVLAERKLSVMRPRLRSKADQGGEVAISAYQRLRSEPRLGERMREILVNGVSTRKYATVLPKMAGTVGVAKSSVSRKFIEASRRELQALMQRRFDEVELLAIYIDGIVVADHHIVTAIGVDVDGIKHLLGLTAGSSENARVVKDLLASLIARGVSADEKMLFVIDGSKALRSAIQEMFGESAVVQRCRTHKLRNVLERIKDDNVRAQTRAVMHAAYKLPEKEGTAKMKQQVQWLRADHPDAAASLLEGLEETFTVNRLRLPPALVRCLSTTNIIENPNGAVRRVSGRVCRYRDADMGLRWTAAGYLQAEKSFRRIQGFRDLWVLATALGRRKEESVAQEPKVA
jgi:putative transposase